MVTSQDLVNPQQQQMQQGYFKTPRFKRPGTQFGQFASQPGQGQQLLGGQQQASQNNFTPPAGMNFRTQSQQNQGGQANPGASSPPLAAPGSVTSVAGLDPYLGGNGKVKIDPYTGNTIDPEDRMKPLKYLSNQLALGQPIQNAMNFDYQNLPENLAPQAASQLLGSGQQLLSQGGSLVDQGGNLVSSAAQNLLGVQGQTQADAGSFRNERGIALSELQQLQQQALSPELDPAQRQYFQQQADDRRAEILSRFGEGGDISQIFQKQRNADVSNLANKGVLDSTSAENTLANRDTQLAALANQLLGNANEQSRTDLNAERNNTRNAATAFGGLQGQQASSSGSLLSSLLGQQAGIGQSIGQLGLGQQGIGAQLSGLGQQGLAQGAATSLAGRGQEADLQQSALSTNLLGNQLGLQNVQSLLNQQLGRKATNQGLDLQQQLAEQAMNPQGQSWWEQILNPFGIFPGG